MNEIKTVRRLLLKRNIEMVLIFTELIDYNKIKMTLEFSIFLPESPVWEYLSLINSQQS